VICAKERRNDSSNKKEERVIFGISLPFSCAFALLRYPTCYLLRWTQLGNKTGSSESVMPVLNLG
jgi:hypothetical protein